MSLLDHAPALEVVVPLMAASLIVLVRNLKFAHLIALLASASSFVDRKSTRLNSSHSQQSRMPSSA